jgi:hypothetical protein
MNGNSTENYTKHLTTTGLLIGTSILVIGLAWGMILYKQPLNLNGLSVIHHNFSALYFFDLVPVIFALAGYFTGRTIHSKLADVQADLESEKSKTKKVRLGKRKIQDQESS